MTTKLVALTFLLCLGALSKAQAQSKYFIQESEEIKKDLSQSGVKIMGMLNTTQDELIHALVNVGGEWSLVEGSKYSKVAYRGFLIVDPRTSPMQARVQFVKGSRDLPWDAAEDLASSAISYLQTHEKESMRQMAGQKFQINVKCIQTMGQAFNEPPTWCGFSTGNLD